VIRLKGRARIRWLSVLSYFFAAIAILAVVALIAVRWSENRILNANGWVSTVAPLPKDPVVASALGTYTVATILDRSNAESRIKNILPPRADFLAAPLFDQINTRANKLATNFISSDQFQSIWIGANRLAISKLLASARGEQSSTPPKSRAKLQLGLNGLRTVIAGKVGSISRSSGSESVSVNLKTPQEKFRTFVRTMDNLNSVLPFLIIAAVLGALACAARRPRMLVIIFGCCGVIALLFLIALNLAKSAIVSEVKQSVYQPAVGRILDSLTANLKTMLVNLFAFSLLVIAIVVTSHYSKAWFKRRLAAYKNSMPLVWWRVFRSFVQQKSYYILGGFTVLVLAYLAFAADQLRWSKIINSVLLISILASTLILIKITPAPQKRRLSR
jgi:hypothetical protein